jgi:general secretion pathway protein M
MSAAIKSPALLGDIKDAASQFWSERNARERTILTAGAAVLLVALLYLILFAPALKGRTQLNKDLPELRQQAAQMQALAAQAAELKSAANIQIDPVSQEGIATSLASRGLKPKNISVSDGLVRLQIDAASFAGLLDWLADQQKTNHLTVLEANFVAQTQVDMVNATVTLKQQRGEG